jgi:hypothetical protein
MIIVLLVAAIYCIYIAVAVMTVLSNQKYIIEKIEQIEMIVDNEQA